MTAKHMIRQLILPLLLSSLVTACGPLVNLAPQSGVLTYYDLTPAQDFDMKAKALPIILLVEQPVAGGDLDSPRIALRPMPLQVQYYGKVKWADRAPRMIQNLLLTSFENSGLVKSVGTEAMGIPADFRLKMTLRDLQADYLAPDAAPIIHVTLSLKLIRKIPMMTVDSKVITASVQAKQNKLPDIMAAFNEATQTVFKETVDWTVVTAAKKAKRPN